MGVRAVLPMETTALLSILVYLIVFVVLVQVAFLILLIRASKTSTMDNDEAREVDAAQGKSYSILHRAMKQANRMLVNAELLGIKSLTKTRMEGRQMTQEYRSHLDAVEEAMKKEFEDNARSTEESYRAFVASLQQTMNNTLSTNQTLLEEKSTILVSQTQELLNRFVSDIHQKVQTQVDAEIAAAREEVEAYKERRKRILNERIIDIVQDVTKETLGKTLSLADQSELVYKALEEAKKEHGFE